MIAFDTDVLTEILQGNEAFATRAAMVPAYKQAIPIIVVEEIMRGRLNMVRRAEADKAKISVERAYALFEATFQDFQLIQILSYTAEAETIFWQWRRQKIRVSTHDMRIGAICVVHNAILISRNRRDYERLPGLQVEFWA